MTFSEGESPEVGLGMFQSIKKAYVTKPDQKSIEGECREVTR